MQPLSSSLSPQSSATMSFVQKAGYILDSASSTPFGIHPVWNTPTLAAYSSTGSAASSLFAGVSVTLTFDCSAKFSVSLPHLGSKETSVSLNLATASTTVGVLAEASYLAYGLPAFAKCGAIHTLEVVFTLLGFVESG